MLNLACCDTHLLCQHVVPDNHCLPAHVLFRIWLSLTWDQSYHAHRLNITCLTSICRHRLWWSYVDEVRKQRDNPQQPDQRTAANSRAAERDRSRSAKDTGDVVDKAYVREYLEPEQKRMRRD